MTYEEYKKQRLAQNNTQSNVSNTTEINTAPVNKYEEYKKQRLTQQQDYSKTLEKETKQAQLAKDFISQNGTEKINSEYNNYMQSMNKAIAPKLYQTEGMQELASKRNATTPLEDLKNKNYTADLLSKIYRKRLNNGKNIVDSPNVIQSSIGRAMGQQPSDRGKLLKVPENMKDNLRRFKDGYQFGDITATALENFGDSATTLGSTTLEIPTRIVKGIFGVSEGMANAGASIIAGAADLIGQDEYANALRKRIAVGTPFVKTHNLLESTADKLDTNSFSGKLLDSATEGVGQSGGQIAVGAALGKFGEVPIKFGDHVLNMPTTAFATGMGSAAAETYAKADEQLGGLENATGKEKLQMALRILGGGTVEGTTEGLFGLLGVGGTDITDEFAKKAVARAGNAFQKQLTKITIAGGGEAAEEFISYASNYLLDNYANKFGRLDFSENWNWDDVMQEMASAFISSGISQGVTSAVQINKATQNAIQLAERKQGRQLTPQEISEIRNSVADEVLGAREELESLHKDTNISENPSNIEQISQNNVQNVSDLEKNQQMSISDEQNNQATVTNEIQTFVENRNKIAPGLNIEMDNTLKTDGVIIKNSDGTRTMKINPNSTRAYEFVAVHEMLHDLEGTQEYSELQKYLQDRATLHENYEEAKQKITEQYENFYKNNNLDMSNLDMNVETVNDMVAQSLGNQQFLNELAGKKPNVFMKMYNWVKNVLFDGQNTGKTFNERRTDNKYLQELKRKFETAYNTAYNNSNMQENYSIGGQNGLKNAISNDVRFKKLENNLNRAKIMAQNGTDNEYIRQNTNWFQDKNGDWKFEFSDKDMSLKSNVELKENTTYKLGDILEHDLLFTIYPELVNYEVGFEDLGDVAGKFNKNTNMIRINNNKLNSKLLLEKTLIHELQHAIQKIENFEQGSSSKFSKLAYYNSLGEIEASDTANRFLYDKTSNFDRNSVTPETSKKLPKHKNLNNYLENRKIIDKIKDGIYKFFKFGGADNVESIESNLENNLQENSNAHGRNERVGRYGQRYLEELENSSSFSLSKDNQGRTLSKEQQEYFKNSKVRDKVGRLSEVYHGTNIDFDVFNAKLSNFGQASSHLNFFTNKMDSYPDSAMDYARNAVQKKGGKERIIKAYLNIKKPYVFDSSEYYNSVSAYDRNYRKIQAEYLSGDYDGIIVKDFSGKNDDVLYAVENSNQIKSVDNTKPTSNPDIRYSQSNGEWSKYLKENWDLMPNSKKTFGFPTNEQLQVMDNKKISESADALNLKEIKKPQKEETYKTNLERSSGLIEQKIKAIEEGKIKRDENAKRVSKEDIRKTIENSINQKLFTKHFREKAYGIYKPSTNTIRLAQRSDFETAIHELGHQIDIKQLDNLSRNADIKVKAELRMLCEKSFPGTYKEIRTQLEEGFAEATRNFIIDSKSFAADYPNTAYLIQNELEKSPQLNKLFNTLQEQIHDYINMTSKDRVLSNVSFEGEEQKPKLTKEYIKDKVIEWVWDDTIPLKRLVEKIAKTKNVKVDNLSPSENIAMSLKLAEGLGDATVSSLRNGYEENGVKQTKGFSEILKDFDHNDIEDLVAYMVSEGNLDYIKANKQTGIRESDAKAVLKKYKDTKISKASAEIREINDYSLKRLLQSGLITKEQVKSFKKVNEHYVPMNRVIDIEGKIGLNAKGLQNGKVIKGRKGSDRMIINPLESTVVNNMRIDRQIANNENLKNLVDTLKQNDLLGEYIDEIPTPMQFKGSATLENFKGALEKQGVDTTELDLEAVYNIFTPKLSDDKNLIMSYMEKGKRKYIQFKDKSLYNVVNGLTGQKGLNGIQKFYSYFNGALRWGATAGNIDFSLPNTISDSQTAFLNSDATFIPIVDSIIGVADAVAGNTAEHSKLSKLVEKIAPDYQKRKARLYELYEKSGAKSTTNRSGLKRSNNLDNVLGALALDEKTLLGKDKARPIRAIKKATEWAPALSEEATRFRNFEKEVKLYQKQGMKLEDAVKKAGYNAKRVTQDFSQSGKATRVVNSVIPFTSARIGGTYQAYENFAKNPKRYSTRLALLTASSAVIHALLIQALKNGTRKDEEEYKELQDQKLLDNYTFPIGDGKTITIKKIQGPVRAIINLTEMAVDYSMGMIDDKGLDKRLKAIANDVKMDNSYLGKPTDVAGQFGTPILENALNKDFYYGNDLVPENMKYLDNANKYDENTTETAKLIGKALNYPPIYIDNLVEGYLAGVGTQTMQVSDWVINKVTGKKSAKRQASESFITKRFIADDYKNSQSVSEIYDTYDELKNDEAEERLTEEQKKQLENIEQAKDTMAIINKKIREAKTDNALNSKEKTEKIRELQKQRTDTARYYLGKETINKENKEQIELYEYYPTATSKISSIIDEEEKNEYAQIVKDTYAFNLKSLEDNKEYIKANEEEKNSMEKTALTQAKNTAKEKMIQNNLEELVEEHGEEETATLILNAEQLKQYEKVEKAGIPLVDYYNAWLAQKDAEGKKNAKGETISGTKKKAKIKAINSAVDDDLTTYQKKALYRIFNVD